MKKSNMVIVLGIIGASMATMAYATNDSAQGFVHKASIANEFEIESSKLALQKSPSSDVKDVAQMMVDDHTKTAEKLDATLKSSNSDAKPADKLDGKHQKLLSKLESASGKNFDDQYIAMQTDAHKQAIDLFSNYANNGSDPALKDFATQTLPDLKKHLQHVQQLASNH